MRKFCLLVFLLFVLFCNKILANDSFSLVFDVTNTLKKEIYIEANPGKTLTIDWGDATVETYTVDQSGYAYMSHFYATIGIYNVMCNANSADCHFLYFWISEPDLYSVDISLPELNELSLSYSTKMTNLILKENNKLVTVSIANNSVLANVDLRNCHAIKNLLFQYNGTKELFLNSDLKTSTCRNNQLEMLDMSECLNIDQGIAVYSNNLKKVILPTNNHTFAIGCWDNKIPLYNLYLISQQVNPNTSCLGRQTLDTQDVILDVPIGVDTVFYGNGTVYSVKLNDVPAIEDIDYVQLNGYFTFFKEGIFSVEITNPAMISIPEEPTKVTANYNVIKLGIEQKSSISVFPNPTTGNVSINGVEGNCKIVVYNTLGKIVYTTNTPTFSISHLPAGMYFVNVNNTTNKIIKN